ncbi:MAG: hypothetical protein KF799_04455 [Bdellovibrionales bacterium]|nr:hypothetical protein [Bdellovibrionales bacterium]
MKSVFEAYKELWPADRHAVLEPYLNKIAVLRYPEDRAMLGKVLAPFVVVVAQKASLRENVALLESGFQHIVQQDREDFPQELLAASLMTTRPDAFQKNPVPFFLSDFQPDMLKDPDKNLAMKFHKSSQKSLLLDWLSAFLQQNPQTFAIHDLSLQAADEMLTNAFFNAPIRPGGLRPFQKLPRDAEAEISAAKSATLFATVSERRMIVGCMDSFGSFSQPNLMEHLRHNFSQDSIRTREGQNGAGLGLRYLIENAANFYLLCHKGISSLVACGFVLEGLKANLYKPKHMHICFWE